MSKVLLSGMDTHLALEATSLATCWKITRTDGVEFFFTDHDVDITFNSDLYIAESGYTRTAIVNDSTLAVDNLDVEGLFDSDELSEIDLRAGKFDEAEVRMFIVNWQDPDTDGDVKMRRGRFGEVTLTERGYFRTELRGMTQPLSQNVGEIYSPECRADLGDSRCKVPVQPPLRLDNTAFVLGDFIRVATNAVGVPNPTVKLLVPGDADEDDATPFAATGTLGSQATQQTTIKKFGAGSIEFSPSGSVDPSLSFLSFPDATQYIQGVQDFAIEGFVRFKSLSDTEQVIASHYLNTGDQRSWFLKRNGSTLEAFFSDDGTSAAPAFTFSGPFTWATDTQFHVAITRDGNTFRLFVDGALIATTTSSIAIHNSTEVLRLGKLRSAGFDDFPLDGFIDDFHITIGIPVYTAAFTAPVAAHPTTGTLIGQQAFEDRIYECTVAGTTTSPAPTYDTIVGNTAVDGTATFTAREAWTREAFIDAVTDRVSFTIVGLTEALAVDDWFNGGALIFEDGENSGRVTEIRSWTQTGSIMTIFLATPFTIVPGTAVRLYPGCDKRDVTCIAKFFMTGTLNFPNGNIKNFRGEPFVPGQDLVTSYPDAQ